jgi:hypothetical protein
MTDYEKIIKHHIDNSKMSETARNGFNNFLNIAMSNELRLSNFNEPQAEKVKKDFVKSLYEFCDSLPREDRNNPDFGLFTCLIKLLQEQTVEQATYFTRIVRRHKIDAIK